MNQHPGFLYFDISLGIAPFVPFLSTYARQLGFSSFTIGIIYTVIPIFGMAAKPLLGIISDKYKCQKQVFIGVVLLTGLTAVGFYYTPRLPVQTSIKITSDGRGELIAEVPGGNSCTKQTLTENDDALCQESVVRVAIFLAVP